jgi:uncharacterized membrane protein
MVVLLPVVDGVDPVLLSSLRVNRTKPARIDTVFEKLLDLCPQFPKTNLELTVVSAVMPLNGSGLALKEADEGKKRKYHTMKRLGESIVRAFLSGLLIVMPIYLSVLLLLRIARSLAGLVRPITRLLPEWFPAEKVLSLLLVVSICCLIGAAARTAKGRAVRDRIDKYLYGRLPGYGLFRGLTQQVAGRNEEHVWQPALVEIEEALVPAFIIEEFEDGRCTVFVPAVPTPFAGSVYILTPERVHPLNVPFGHAVKAVTRWGSGSKDLVAAMKPATGLRDKTA